MYPLRMTRLLLVLLLLIINYTLVFAQARSVKGKVTDQQGAAVEGATVAIKGTKQSSMTNEKGDFTINVSSNDAILVVSYTGMIRKEIKIGSEVSIAVQLSNDDKSLDDVIVVGYGVQSRKKTLGSISTVSARDIEDLPVSNLGAALQGRLPNIAVTGGTERPGANATITIRNPIVFSKNGVTGTNPLYIIDDVVRTIDDFNTLDPSEIDNISFLKDAAAAVYGARSGNGAVVIKTKRGRIGKTTFGINSSIAFNDATSLPKMMNGYELASYLNKSQQGAKDYAVDPVNGYQNQATYYTDDELAYFKDHNTDWLDMAWKTSTFTRHALNISGGSDRATFFASVAYVKQDGNLPNIDINKLTFRASSDFKVSKDLSAGISISGDLTNNTQYLLKQGGENAENDMKGLLYTPGFSPAYINGLPVKLSTASNQNTIDAFHFFEVQRLDNYNKSRGNGMNVQATINYSVPFIKGLAAKVMYSRTLENTFPKQFGTQYKLYSFKTAGGHNHLYGDSVLSSTIVTNGNRIYFKPSYSDAYQLDGYLTYNGTFGLHNISAVAVVEQSETNYDDVQAYTDGPTEGAPDIQRYAFGANNIFETASEDGRRAYIGRLNYGFSDKYLAEFAFRYDASTLFIPGKRWGFFPSVSAGWIISQENFFKNVKAVNFLKFRASWGHLGSDNTQPYRYLLRYTVTPTSGAVFGGNANRSVGTKVEELSNPYALWDDVIKLNGGVDATFLNNRLSTTLDVYRNHGYNLLTSLSASVPLLVGAAIGPENFSVANTFGYELSLGWKDNIGKNVTYYVNPYFAWSDNKIIKTDIAKGDIGTYKDVTGKSSDQGFLGLHTLGMFRSWDEVNAFKTKNPGYTVYNLTPRPGMLYYQDVRGPKDANNKYTGPDGKIDDNDMDYLTKRSSNHYGFGTSLGVAYKNLRLDMVIAGSFGGQGTVEGSARKLGTATASRPVFWNDAYGVDNPNGKYPNPYFSASYDVASDFWFKSSTTVRMRSANLSYTLPVSVNRTIGFTNLKVYITATNPLNFYNPYKFYRDNSLSAYDVYPTLRTFAFGINANL